MSIMNVSLASPSVTGTFDITWGKGTAQSKYAIHKYTFCDMSTL